jgi:hypothetical protein
MADAKDVQPHFKAILGDLFDEKLIGGPFPLTIDRGFYQRFVSGFIKSETFDSTTGESFKRCNLASLWDVGGSSRTKPNGIATFNLSDFWCNQGHLLSNLVDFVATPWTSLPVYLTYQRELVMEGASPNQTLGPGNDVRITVRTWNPDGSPAGDVSFTWRCLVGFLTSGGVE